MKTRLLKTIHYGAVVLTLVLIVLLTIYSLLWALKPVLASETGMIQSYLSHKLKRPVEIQSLSLDIEGLTPALVINGLSIFSPDHQQKIFAIDQLWIGFNYIYVNNIHLVILKNKEGKWEIEHLSDLLPHDTTSTFTKKFKFEGDNISLTFMGVFPKPIVIQHIIAKVDVEAEKIIVTHLKARNRDVSVTGRANLSSHYLDMTIKYHVMPSISQNLDNYLPQNIMPGALLHWLVNAIKRLDSADGIFVLQGAPEDFPYDHAPGKFLVNASIKNLDLNYDPEWPAATHINGELQFLADSMQMDVKTARLSGVNVNNIETVIPVLSKDAVLHINGSVNSDTSNMLGFIADSPLKNTIGKYFNKNDWQGSSHLQLSLAIPLTPTSEKLKVDGKLALAKNTATLSEQTKIQDINGIIIFNENGVVGKSVTGLLEDKPISVDIINSEYFAHYKEWKIKALDKGEKGWVFNVAHPQARGVVKYKDNKLSGIIDYIYLKKDSTKNTEPLHHPEKIPAINIVVKDFQYNDKKFGEVTFRTTPTVNGLILNNMYAHLGSTTIDASGNWKNNISGVKGTLVSVDTQAMLENWGLSRSLDSQSATVNYQLNWEGNLYSPDLKSAQGNIRITIGKGRIKHVGSQAQMDFGRLITLLSFQSLAKKLSLDFSDFTKKGLNFDSITGDFVLNDGIATTNNTFIDAQIANINMAGSIDIINETYNLTLMVTPDLTSSLPVIATIAGGPIAGAAVWAANKLINPLVNKITHDTYTITGTWDDPIVK